MSKYTVEQFKRMLARIYGRGCLTGHSLTVDGNYIDYSHNEFEDVYAESVGVMIDEDEEAKMISATLSQQAEWPSDEDARSVLIDWFGPAKPYTNREVERMRAALQSVRPPAHQVDRSEERLKHPPCLECGAKTEDEAQTKCICAGDKDDCHGVRLWPDDEPAKPDADLWESRELGADERYVGVVPNSTPDAGVVTELIAHRHARQVPDGWVLVPIQMTEEMDRAGWPADTAQEGWERAIKAAPPAPEKD